MVPIRRTAQVPTGGTGDTTLATGSGGSTVRPPWKTAQHPPMPLGPPQNVFNMKLAQVEREVMAKANAMSYAIEDLPILINLNPHPVASEQLAHVLRPGETYLGTDDEPITDETKDDIRCGEPRGRF